MENDNNNDKIKQDKKKPSEKALKNKYNYIKNYMRNKYNNDLEYAHILSLKVCIRRINKLEKEERDKKINWLSLKHPDRLNEMILICGFKI